MISERALRGCTQVKALGGLPNARGLEEDAEQRLTAGVYTKNYIALGFFPPHLWLHLSSQSVLQQINLDIANGFMLA